MSNVENVENVENVKNINDVENINDELDKKISKILTKYKKSTNYNITNLVLSGGGLKGISTIGALKIFNDNKILDDITTIAGTSVGALIAGLYCIGYSFDEICKLIMKLDIENIICPNPVNILDYYALDTGERFEYVLTKIIESKKLKKTISLKEVYEIKKINLIITGACLNDGQIYYFSHINNPDMPLITCIRISASIPIIFKPVTYCGKTYVDGGIIDNYPMHLFKNDMSRTLGIYVQDSIEYKNEINSIEKYAYSLLKCTLGGQINQTYFCTDNSLIIETPHVYVTEKIDIDTKKKLYFIGCEKAKQFIKKIK